jgi:O-antigen ligase
MTPRRLPALSWNMPAGAAVPASVAAALLAGRLVITHRHMAELAAALVLMLPLLVSPRIRTLFIVFGGLLVFQSSDALSTRKLLFLMGAAVCVAGALANTWKLSRQPGSREIAPLFAASRAFVVLILASLPVSLAYGASHKEWVRDASVYLLFAAAPVLAFDAQTGFTPRGLRRLLVAAGAAGTAAYAAQWLSSRGILHIPGSFGLPTFLLGGALFAYAMAVVLEGERGRLRWLLVAAIVFAAYVVTGTRSSLVFLAAPVAILIGARHHAARRFLRLAIALPIAALLVGLSVQYFVREAGAKGDVLTQRLQLLYHSGSVRDGSYIDRRNQDLAAWKLFKQHPLLGTAPGHPIPWINNSGSRISAATVDSPVEYLAKFGLVGLWPLAVLVVSTGRMLRRLRRRTEGRSIAQLALIGYAGIIVAWSALSVAFDDKGFASGVLLLLAVALSEARRGEEADGR